MSMNLVPVSSGRALRGQRPTENSRHLGHGSHLGWRASQVKSSKRSPLRNEFQGLEFVNKLFSLKLGIVVGLIVGLFSPVLCVISALFYVVRRVFQLFCRLLSGPEATDVPNPGPRIASIGLAAVAAVTLIAYRVYSLQGIDVQRWRQIAAKQHESSLTVYGARGTIFDSEGRTLAASVKTLALGVHPREILPTELERYVTLLSPLLGQSQQEVRLKLRSPKSFIWLEHGLAADLEERLKPEMLKALVYIPEFQRSYPQGQTAIAVLGRVGRDGVGLSGLERSYDKQLRAPTIHLPVRRDARGRLLQLVDYTSDPMTDLGQLWDKVAGKALSIAPEGSLLEVKSANASVDTTEGLEQGLPSDGVRSEGHAIRLTLDSFLQDIVEQELERGRIDAKAKRTFGVLVDAETGAILAMGQTPGVDPNDSKQLSPELLRNALIQDSFEPGSTIKPLIMAAAIDEKVVESDSSMDCESGSYRVGPHTVRDVHPQAVLSMKDVLVRSSNICMSKIGQKLGAKRLGEVVKAFGFGEPVRIELPGEAKGILRNSEGWAEIDVATHSFGQGFSVTPLQMVQAYSTLANGGLLVRPHLVASRDKLGKESIPTPVRVLSPESARAVSDMLLGVIEDPHGTGKAAAVPGMSVRGKTGTAQKARADGRGYDPDNVLASFIGYIEGSTALPNRKLVFYVAVDEPGVYPRWGGALAAPIFQRAMERIVAHLLAKGDSRPVS